jgi:hypothetical protein
VPLDDEQRDVEAPSDAEREANIQGVRAVLTLGGGRWRPPLPAGTTTSPTACSSYIRFPTGPGTWRTQRRRVPPTAHTADAVPTDVHSPPGGEGWRRCLHRVLVLVVLRRGVLVRSRSTALAAGPCGRLCTPDSRRQASLGVLQGRPLRGGRPTCPVESSDDL